MKSNKVQYLQVSLLCPVWNFMIIHASTSPSNCRGTSVGKFPGNAVPVPTPKFEFFRGFVPENPQFFFVICPHLVPEVLLEVDLIPVPEIWGISGNVPEKPQYDQP